MYAKLAIRNMKRSAKDYLIYLVTLMIAVGLFYGFLSIVSPFYNKTLPVQMNLDYFSARMKIIIPLIALLIVFLILFVNRYMLRRKQKEFAIQTIMGMEKRTTAFIFFIETFTMGCIAVFIGIAAGALVSQVVSAMVMQAFEQDFHIYFSLYPDTVMWTILFFAIVFLLIGVKNIWDINKTTIIQMLHNAQKTETGFSIAQSLSKWVVFTCLLAGLTLKLVFDILLPLGNSLSTQATMLLNVLAGILTLIIILAVSFLISARRRKKAANGLSLLLAISSLSGGIILLKFGSGFEQLVSIGAVREFYIVLPPMIAILLIVFSIMAVFNCISWVQLLITRKFREFHYRNIFVLAQLNGRLKTNTKTMGVLSCVILAAIILIGWLPAVIGEVDGYLKARSAYDIQVFTQYHGLESVDELPQGNIDFSYINSYIENNGYHLSDSATAGIYFLQDRDFYKRIQVEMPILAVPLSDYNALLQLAGIDPVTLPHGSFAVAWNNTALEDEIANFEQEHPTIQAGDYTLNKTANADYQYFIGLGLFTSRMNAVYIIPDDICKILTLAATYYAANTTEPLTYSFAKDLESDAMDYLVKANNFPENVLYIRLRELQLNEGISNSLMLRLGGTYTALMLIVICFTILSLQQLTDALEHKNRFKIILKLGVSEQLASKYICQQIGVWFGLPIGLSLIGGAAALIYLAVANYRTYIPYVSVEQLITGIAVTYGIILLVLMCYFISTYYLFRRMVFAD